MQDVQLSPAFIAWAQRRDRASVNGGSNASTGNEGLYSFKYHNKPASVDPSSFATIFAVPSTSTSSQSTEADTIYASFPSTKQGVGKNKGKQVEHRFVGTETQAKEVDVVLVWDEASQCWSLEPLVSSLSFKPDRTPNSKAPPTPAVPSAHELQSTTRAFFDSDATNPFAFVAAQPPAKNEDKPPAKRPKSSSSASAPPPPGLASLLNPASSPSANGGLPPSAAQSEDEDDDMFEEVGVGESQPPVADVPSYLRTPGGGTAPLPDLAPVSAPPPVPPKPPSPPRPVAQLPAPLPSSRPIVPPQPKHSPPRPAPPQSAPAPARPHPSYGSKIPASYTRQLAQKAKEADEASSDSDEEEDEDEYEDEDVQMRPVGASASASASRPPAQGKKAIEADRTTRSGATFASAPAQSAHLGPSSKPAPPSRSTTAAKSIQRVAPNISDSSSSDSSSDSDDSDSGGVPSAVRAQMSRQVNAQMAKVRSGTGTPVPPAVPTGAGQRRVDYPSIQAAQAVQQQQARWQQQVQAQQQQRAAAQAAASAAGRPAPGQVGRKGLAPPVRTAASLDPRQAEIENDIPDSSEEE